MENKNNKTNTALAVIITIFVLVTIAGIGIGAFFVGKMLSKKEAQENPAKTEEAISSPTESVTEEATSGATNGMHVTIKTRVLEDLFQYPDSLSFESSYNFVEGTSKIMLKIETLDNADTIYDYYNELALINNWGLGSQGLASDISGGWINIEETDFQAEIQINNENGKRTINIVISYISENMSFGKNKPQKTTANTTYNVPNGNWEYVIADSNSRIISESELINLTPWQLKVARNEIYARHGRKFVHEDLQCHFGRQSWYQIDPSFQNSDLSSIENKNVDTILNYETRINSPYLRYDSGCH